MYYIGIDLGTSAVKLLLMDETGRIDNIVSREYGIAFPHPGWSEQEPADWWDAVCDGIPALLQGFDASLVKGIGAGGQMHGLVVLDKADKVIRPCILWNDGRTQKQVDYLNNEIGKDKLSRYTANIAFAGFTAPKLLWLRDNEPENFARIEKIMLPKDYINYRLTGVHCTDYSDASGMLLLDVEHKCWSREMLDLCGVREAQLPKLFESWQPVGTLTAEAAAVLGLFHALLQPPLFDKHRLFFIYAHIFLAAAHAMLDAREKALESLRAALDAALPDDVLMPFVENADLVLPLLLAPQETRHEDDVRRILALAEPWLRHLGLPGTRASEIPFGLSVKQYEIARLAAEGRTGPEIACRVGLGLNTVKTHLKTVYRKCGANNRPELRRLLHGEK